MKVPGTSLSPIKNIRRLAILPALMLANSVRYSRRQESVKFIRVKLWNRFVPILLVFLVISPADVIALSQPQADVFNSGIYYFNVDASTQSSITCGGSGATSGGGSQTLGQVETFASEPITSTWNISDSTVEQWFLKQANAIPVITKYGLKSSNISQITSVVRAAGVSPVFFYLYTVNEGGGAGGFINHYGSDISGGGPANATRDAQYLAAESQTTKDGPATSGGEPPDMPTAEAKAILDSLPLGSLGVAYIQATAATTAELESLSGKTGDWTGKYTSPLSSAMQNIQSMGGDPLQGGAPLSAGGCTGGVAGQGITKAVNWAVMIANNDGYGYDEAARTSGWAAWQADPSCTTQCGSFDCSSFLSAALTEAGYFKTNPEFTTQSEASALSSAGFTKIASSATSSANLQPGDILLNTQSHTAMYIGNNQVVEASINENGTTTGGQVGDQTGREIWVTQFFDYPWDSVWRASN